MNLNEWLRKNNKTQVQFARELEISDRHLNLVVCRRGNPSITLCNLIEKKTNGQVTINDMIGAERCSCCKGKGYIKIKEGKNG